MSRLTNAPTCRPALASERQALEDLQRRASLANPNDREALLSHPEAIQLPLEQIIAGHVFVVERDGATVAFAAGLPRDDGNSELDALFVEPDCWKQGLGRFLIEHCAGIARTRGSGELHVIAIHTQKVFTMRVASKQIGTVQTRFGVGLLFRRSLR